MARLTCPECAARFPEEDGWAKTAVCTLMAAPAVRDMATQVRCPSCQHVFADSDIRYLEAAGSKGTRAIVWIAIAAAVAWAAMQLRG